MGYPAYYGRPALVASYRRVTAPFSVHLVALFQYVGGLLTLLAATGVVLLVYGRGKVLDEQRIQIPETMRRQIVEGQAGLVMAIGLAIVALMWLLIARSLQRGGQWARITVLMLSVLSIAATGWDASLAARLSRTDGATRPVFRVLATATAIRPRTSLSAEPSVLR